MKFGLKKWLSAMCVMGLFLAFGLTASAGKPAHYFGDRECSVSYP